MRTEPARNIKSVDGVEVVDWRLAETGLSGSDWVKGRLITFDTTEELILADGTTTYGCVHPGCTFTSTHALSVASHHYIKAHEPRVPKAFAPYLDWSLRDLLETVHQADAAIRRLMEQAERFKAEKVTGYSKKRLERLEAQNEELRGEIQKLSSVRDALKAINRVGA